MKHLSRTAILFLSVLRVSLAAKTFSLHQATSPAQRQNSTKLFTIFHRQTCVGAPYTKDPSLNCDGWTGLTQDACEKKCADDAKAPNCPKETCHAAVFYPASGACHLFKGCESVEPSPGAVILMDQAMVAKEQANEKALKEEQEEKEYGITAELMSAMPMVLINLTNISTLMHDAEGSLMAKEVTHRFGNIADDLELLYDKVQGFLLALHDRMGPGEGEKYCPFRKEQAIYSCVGIAKCIIQGVVPSEISMEAFASIEEQIARFEEVTWPLLKQAFIAEGDKEEEAHTPEQYICDGTTEADPHALAAPLTAPATSATAAAVPGAFLQTEVAAAQGSRHAQTLATSAALRQAMGTTRRILDAHGLNTSMETTGQHLEKLWGPLCKTLPCDPTNMHDVFLASHKQSMALFETGAVGHLHVEIRHRIKMDMRLQRFVTAHHNEHVHFFHEQVLDSSKEAVAAYGMRGREGVLRVITPYVDKMARRDAERAVRLVDHVEFEKFARDMLKKERLEKKRAKPHGSVALLEEGSDASEEEEDEEEEDEEAAHDGEEHEEEQAEEEQKEQEEQEEGEQGPLVNTSLLSTDQNASGRHWMVGKTVVLWCHAQQHYVRMSRMDIERGHKGFHQHIPYSWTWERFVVVDAGNGNVAFHSTGWNKFLRMYQGKLMGVSGVASAESFNPNWSGLTFKLKDMGGGNFGLYSTDWRRFVNMPAGHKLDVTTWRKNADDLPSSWTTAFFYIQETAQAPAGNAFWWCDRTVALWSHASQFYIRMNKHKIEPNHGWKDPFPAHWEFERWVPVMAGHGEVAFHNTKWNRFLRMNNRGGIDTSSPMGRGDLNPAMTWERFRMVDMGHGQWGLYNSHFRRFVATWHGNTVGTTGQTDWWHMQQSWGYAKIYVQYVGEAKVKKKCNFWCRMRRGIEKVINKIADFVKKLLECFGQWSSTSAVGYNREIGQYVGLSFGVSAGFDLGTMKKLFQGQAPGVSFGADVSVGAAGISKWAWAGVGASAAVSCGGRDNMACSFGFSVGAVFTAWSAAGADARCVLGPTLFGAMDCSRSVGGTFLIICCSFDLTSGKNNCR